MPISLRVFPGIDESGEDALGIFNGEFLWPAKGDRLFGTAGDWERRVDFTNHRISRHIDIWDGYMLSGKILVAECKRDPTLRQNSIYPILYCHRHGLELAMKWVIWIVWRTGWYLQCQLPRPRSLEALDCL